MTKGLPEAFREQQEFGQQLLRDHRQQGGRGPDIRPERQGVDGTSSGARRIEEGEGGSRPHSSTQQEPQGDVRDAESTEELSDEQALLLARSFEARRNPFSDQWKDLVHHGRTFVDGISLL